MKTYLKVKFTPVPPFMAAGRVGIKVLKQDPLFLQKRDFLPDYTIHQGGSYLWSFKINKTPEIGGYSRTVWLEGDGHPFNEGGGYDVLMPYEEFLGQIQMSFLDALPSFSKILRVRTLHLCVDGGTFTVYQGEPPVVELVDEGEEI